MDKKHKRELRRKAIRLSLQELKRRFIFPARITSFPVWRGVI